MNRSVSARNRLLNVSASDFESGLQLATEGKVTNKNAWEIKLIEGLTDNVENVMTQNDCDAYMRFTKAASVVEGAAKVWSHRVDYTHQLTTQAQRRLLRCDTRKDDTEDGGDVDEKDEKNGTGGMGEGKSHAPNGEGTGRKGRMGARREDVQRSTLAENPEDLLLQKTADLIAQSCGSDPLFKATSRKFDQGHAQGFLLNNTHIGSECNIMLAHEHAAMVGSAPLCDRHEHGIDLLPDEDCILFEREEREESELLRRSGTGVLPSESGGVSPSPHITRERSVLEKEFDTERSSFPLEDNRCNGEVPQPEGPSGFTDSSDEDHEEDLGATAVGMAAEAFLSGEAEMDRFDRLLEQRAAAVAPVSTDGNPDWIPLDETSTSLRFGETLEEIQKASAVDALSSTAQSMTSGSGDFKRKRPRVGKGRDAKVRFLDEALVESLVLASLVEDENEGDERNASERNAQCTKPLLPGVKMLKSRDLSAVTPLGKEWFRHRDEYDATRFTDPMQAAELAARLGITTSSITITPCAPSSSSASNLHLFPSRTEPRGQAVGSYFALGSDVRGFFQPFCTSAPHWSFLEKRTMSSNHLGSAASLLHDTEGDNHPNTVTTSEMRNERSGSTMPLLMDMEDDDLPGGEDDTGDEDLARVDRLDSFLGTSSNTDSSFLRSNHMVDEGVEGGTTVRSSMAMQEEEGGNIALVAAAEPILNILNVKAITKPSVVDVSKLREIMWRHTDLVLQIDEKEARMSQSRKVHRKDEEDDDDDEGVSKPVSAEARKTSDASNSSGGGKTTFSQVIQAVLPDVPKISHDGKVSPAFFYFSLLFLANEHELHLKQAPDLSDIEIYL